MTTVIFRTEKDGQTLAVFPYEINDHKGNVTCYAHLGQHSGMDLAYMKQTTPCQDFAQLKSELESLGYNLLVRQRINYNKYLRLL